METQFYYILYIPLAKSQNQQLDTYMYVSLPLEHRGTSTLPIDVAITAQKTDLVIVNSKDKYVTLFELSIIPLKTNI